MAILLDTLSAAKAYARFGWRVVILHGVRDGVCTCRKAGDCPSPAKHPRLTRWHEQATTDESELERLFLQHPDSNLGVRLGPTSGIVDVEYDDAQGEATAERLLSGIETPTYRSARSTHRLFRFPEGLSLPSAVAKADGLELRFGVESRGSQSVFPPSVHASGVRYEWLARLSPAAAELAAFPEVLVELLRQPQSNGNGSLEFTMRGESESLQTHPGASQGSRNETLCRLVGLYLAANGADAALPSLALAWAQRCSPAFPDADVIRIVSSLASKEQARRVHAGNGLASVSSGNGHARQTITLSLASRHYSDIAPRSVEWLWPSRIALGKLSLLVGQPGLGKTFLACDLAARVSNGDAFPDGSQPTTGEAAILTAEDGASDTLRPRLDAAGADVSRVHHLDGLQASDGKPHALAFDRHLPAISEWLDSHPDVRLFVIDPISAFLGSADSHKNADVRGVLGPLAELAERHRVAMLGITHLSKGQAKTINRVIGSIAFVAAARAAWLVGEDPDHTARRLFLPIKNNLGSASGLAYRLAGDGQSTRIEWEPDAVLISADDIDGDGEGTSIDEARAWLEAQLHVQGVPSAAILKKAKADGIAEKTLRRAKMELAVISEREGKAWVWRLPSTPAAETSEDAFVVE